MNREKWIAGRRDAVEAEYDATADTYDDDLYPNDAQVVWVQRLLSTCPEGACVLDAPCGTGRYFAQVVAAQRRVVGADQSAGMLAQADARGLAEELHQVRLQSLPFTDRFDAAVTIDAMENVPPEDWPVVVANVRRALRPGAHWYVTVEEQDREETGQAYERLIELGLPAELGEVVEGDVAGYHYYPERVQVVGWFEAAGFVVVDEDVTPYDGWAYRHFLLRSDGGAR